MTGGDSLPPAAVVVTPPSLPRMLTTPRPKALVQQNHHRCRYIVITLERASPTSPWGLSLRRNSDGSFCVGDSIRSIIRGCWMVDSETILRTIHRNVLPAFVSALFREIPIYTALSSMRLPAHDILQPADAILSVGGTPVHEFTTMNDFKTFCGKAPTNLLQWVVRRDYSIDVIQQHSVSQQIWTPRPTNPLFRTERNTLLEYQDDPYDPDDGTRAQLFVLPMGDFDTWLTKRKRHWRTLYEPYNIGEEESYEWEDSTVARDFWSSQGFASLESWVVSRTQTWGNAYSWNRAKRQRLQSDVCQSVSLQTNVLEWLRVRKNQWRIQRRKRRQQGCSCNTKELQMIDELIAEEEKEEQKKLAVTRTPLDISLIFDIRLGCPDDVVCNIFGNLLPVERLRLLQLNTTTRTQLISRENVWRRLCPSHWKLPRRPRKPWYMLYQHNLRIETEASRKKWDDLLSQASSFLLSGDLLGTLEKHVKDAEDKFQFDINYASGVVCERNALLNLAVIHQRHKVVRWLVEVKGADIETCDRGNFTPLLNAAWAGDKYLVRYLMQQGANRTKVGRFHYTKPVAPLDFAGHTAEGWAAERGHAECARLLALGL